jgi:hypothetical protein
VYSREIDGEEYTFGVSGKLIMNVLVMYDRQTGSLWSQIRGDAVEGPLEGASLTFLPSWMTTWEDWKSRHPDTLALEKGYSGNNDPYRSYYQSGQTGVIGESRRDDRLYAKEFVIGVDLDGKQVAFPYSKLNDEPVLNYFVGDVPVLVVFNTRTGTGVVFDRRHEGQLLTFESRGDLSMVDRETGTTWDALTGMATEGTLAGGTLERLKSTASFWFGWKDWFPESEIYGIGE